jgi:hypothetical protein
VKAERINMPSRTVRFSELKNLSPSDRTELMVTLGYQGHSNCLDGIAMERVIQDTVRAVNCHDELVDALKLFVDEYEGDGHDDREQRPEMKAARAALAKAKGTK